MNKANAKLVLLLSILGTFFVASTSVAEDRAALDADVDAAINLLLETSPAAKRLAPKAKGALVFPNVVKAGFLVGVQYGNGALVRRKQEGGYYIVNYYSLNSGSYGLQAGVQSFAYVMALMTDAAVEKAERGEIWELGVGPSVVVVDEGFGKSVTSSTLTHDIYAVIFDQMGAMAGAGIQGSKITRISK